MRKILTIAFGALLIGLAAIPAAADEWNKKTTITFNQPVEVPGMVLPAGTYVFKLADSMSDRHIVLIYNADETKLLKMILAIDNYRLVPTDKQVVTFAERAKDAPEALRAWFFGGDTWGHEFVYPKTRAKAIAEEAKEPVLSAEVQPAEEPNALLEEPVEAITPEREALAAAELNAEFEPAEPTAVAEETAVEPVPEIAVVPVETLPQTGTSLPLIGLLGAGSLALGGLLKLIPRHTR